MNVSPIKIALNNATSSRSLQSSQPSLSITTDNPSNQGSTTTNVVGSNPTDSENHSANTSLLGNGKHSLQHVLPDH